MINTSYSRAGCTLHALCIWRSWSPENWWNFRIFIDSIVCSFNSERFNMIAYQTFVWMLGAGDLAEANMPSNTMTVLALWRRKLDGGLEERIAGCMNCPDSNFLKTYFSPFEGSHHCQRKHKAECTYAAVSLLVKFVAVVPWANELSRRVPSFCLAAFLYLCSFSSFWIHP